MKGQPRPYRKKTLPVPGDVFIDGNGWMRIIFHWGYSVNDGHNEIELPWERSGFTPLEFIVNWEIVGFYFLGNALTDEWENG